MTLPQGSQLEEAADPSTPPMRLHELARNGGAREKRAVAANPNASNELLVWLARWHWEAVLKNPVLPLLLMEDPNFPAKLPVIALREILKLEEPPREFLVPLQRHPNEEIREAARLHRTSRSTRYNGNAAAEETPSFGLQLRGGAALAEVVTLGLAPTWLLLSALESSEIGLRMRAAKCVQEQGEGGPLHGRLQLLMDAGADAQLRFLGKGRRDMEPESLSQLAEGGPFARRLAARHARTPAESLMKLAGVHGEFMVRCCAAKNPSTPVPTLMSLAGNHDWRIRQAVAKNRQSPHSLLEQLATDPAKEVRAAVAANPSANASTLSRLAVDVEPEVRVTVARHPSTEESILHLLKKDADDEVRRTLAKRRSVPVDILRELMRDGDSYVRMLAVRNRAMPGDVDVRMHRHFQQTPIGGTPIGGGATPLDAPTTAQEQDWKRLMDLFQRREITLADLHEAALHPDPLLRARVASYDLADADLLARLGEDASEAVRSTVAANVKAPLATRLALAEDSHPQVRGSVVAAPEVPEGVVAQLSRDADENVRWRVAYSRHTPSSVLLRMATEESSTRVLETLCGCFDNRPVPNEVLLRVMERLPAAVKKLVYRDVLTVPVLEALIPRLDPHDRKSLLYHQSYARQNGREVRAIPPHLLLRLCDLPVDQKWFAREIRLQVVAYWAVTPRVLESVARAELDQTRVSKQRRAAASGVLTAVARHPLAPSHLLAELLWHSCHDVRLAALENPNTPVEARRSRMGPVLQSAGAGSAVSLRLCALSHPDTTQDMLRKAAFHGRWMERFAVAHNPSTSRQVLAYLREDANTAVASAAREQFTLRFPES
ncbi:hypothetical protein DES53_103363 [Roseimicrobium gellanilyticum]|uniref:Leucine rich repeat variant domain-containing protein n=1 Tax=Roseimicrobium gellanilyticum TaxID=748857 RepID=A0A366HPE3_9BACT|nr:hypothetical protein [Roseimicrobium gellanilyticum]RBP45365.1 hypothetical protein DES53_103363 [Roseimicrobium gellanilyticum]